MRPVTLNALAADDGERFYNQLLSNYAALR